MKKENFTGDYLEVICEVVGLNIFRYGKYNNLWMESLSTTISNLWHEIEPPILGLAGPKLSTSSFTSNNLKHITR